MDFSTRLADYLSEAERLWRQRQRLAHSLCASNSLYAMERRLQQHLTLLSIHSDAWQADSDEPDQLAIRICALLTHPEPEQHSEAISLSQKSAAELGPEAPLAHTLVDAWRLMLPLQPDLAPEALSALLPHPALGGLAQELNDRTPFSHAHVSLQLAQALEQEPHASLLAWLRDHEDQHPELIFPAYAALGSLPARQQVLAALANPHLARPAAAAWHLITGQALDFQPAVGAVGQAKSADGPVMPDRDSAEAWAAGHQNAGPILFGQPQTPTQITTVLGQFSGRTTIGLWQRHLSDQLRQTPTLPFTWHGIKQQALAANTPVTEGANHAA